MKEFHDLYVRYAGDVHRFATYLSGDRAMADDLTSETFLRAWTTSAPIREGTVKAYLFTIARNLYFAEVRRAARHEALADTLPSPAPGPAERAEHHATLDRVLKALRGLPAIDRAALLGSLGAAPPPDQEVATFDRIRRYNRYRNQFFAFGLAFALVPFAFAFANGSVTWFMLRDSPKQAVLFLVASAYCWISRAVLGRQMRSF